MPERLHRFQSIQEARSGHRKPQGGPELPPVSLPGSVAGPCPGSAAARPIDLPRAEGAVNCVYFPTLEKYEIYFVFIEKHGKSQYKKARIKKLLTK